MNKIFLTEKKQQAYLIILSVACIILFFHQHIISAQNNIPYPVTRQDNFLEIIHGVEIVDPYRWLEDQQSDETRNWIEAQQNYLHSLVDVLPYTLSINKRLQNLMQIDEISIPMERNGQYYFAKRKVSDDLWIWYLKNRTDGSEQILLDPHILSTDGSKTIHIQDISADGTLLVYGIRTGGQDELKLRLFDVRKRLDMPDQLPWGVIYGLAFKNDNSGFYYSLLNRNTGPRLYFHKIGTHFKDDKKLFGDGLGPETGLSIVPSPEGKYHAIIVEHGWTKSDVYLFDTDSDQTPRSIIRGNNANFFPEIDNDRLYVQTDWHAPGGRIILVDPDTPLPKDWIEIIPANKEEVIKKFLIVRDKIIVNYMHNVSSRIKIFSLKGEFKEEITLPGLCSVKNITGIEKGSKIFYSVESFNQPKTIYTYDFESKESAIWAEENVPFASEKFVTQQVWYSSKDGTRIPMFLIHAMDIQENKNHPVLLYGYGGFGISLTPYFSPISALWVEKGGIYAVANIRGGGEFGEKWHKAGILENKQNSIDDFIAAAEWLMEKNYTNPQKLAIQGGSNGGLLVGAALTKRPALFKAVLCEYPDLDIIGYPRFAFSPAAMLEYGNATDYDAFQYILKYSPYQNVKHGEKYPAVLIVSGDSDTRVPPLQSRKMTARLQFATASDNPVLLLYNTQSGHSGGRKLSKVIDDLTLKMAFLFWQVEMYE